MKCRHDDKWVLREFGLCHSYHICENGKYVDHGFERDDVLPTWEFQCLSCRLIKRFRPFHTIIPNWLLDRIKASDILAVSEMVIKAQEKMKNERRNT